LVLIGQLIRWSLSVRKRAKAMLIKLTTLLDEAKCYEVIRQLRWPEGVVCLHCRGTGVVRNGHDDRERHRQRYLCKTCQYRFDDLTGTVLAGHHQPVSTWILGSYFMGVNLSNRQIAHELCESDVQAMVLRHGIVAKTPEVVLSGDVEFDELYVVAGHKGNPEAVRAKGRDGRRNRLKGGRGTLEKEKPPIFGMIERGGQVVIRILANVQQKTLHPIIEKLKVQTSLPTSIASTPGSLVSATATRQSVMVEANTPATATASARSTPWRASGRFCDPGCIAVFRRRSCRSISASFSSFTMPADGERRCSAP
jgi:transposase-like protein